MRYMNEKKEKPNSSEKKRTFRSNKRLWQRLLSFVTVLALVVNTMYSGGLFGLFDFPTTVNAAVEIPSYTATNPKSDFANATAFSFLNGDTGKRRFVDYCYYYNTDDVFADYHKADVLSIAFFELPESFSFMGLGNDTHPFAGRVTFIASGGMANISLPRALFTHVSTDARLTDNEATPNDINLEITKNSSASSPLLADYVHAGTGAANWKISVASANTNAFAGVIGEIEASTSVGLTFNNQSSATVSNTATGDDDIKDVGELCGIMKTGSSLTVIDNTTTRTAVSSSGGNAGSLVGTMEGTATLTLSTYPTLTGISVTSENGYAGGLVGDMASTATISGLSSPEAISGSVTGTTGAGGLYGHYTNGAATFDLKDYNITATVSADNCGGVFGVLDNNKGEGAAIALTIKNTGSAGTLTANSGTTANANGNFGGIAGKYTTDALTNSLILDGLTLTANAKAAYSSFGGAIGIVDSAAFIQTTNTVSITATGTTSSSYFGGLVGATSTDNGVFIDLNTFTLNTGSEEFKGGGIVGLFNKGVLRISGTTTMTNAKPASADNCGQLVGKNDNVLVYTPGSWTYARSSGALADDLGTWGEVVRIADIETNILTLNSNSTNHTVTVGAAVPVMTTQNHLVLNALNMQLDSCGCLIMPSTRTAMYSTDLSLGENLSFAETGITGFMRDGGSVSDIGCYTGTFNGGNKTITLAIGEKYGNGITSSSTAEGIGQIYRHQHNGLFANLAGTVQNLTIDGTINVSNCVAGMNIGGVASRNGGDVTLTKVVANEIVNYNESSSVSVDTSKAEGKNIGGYIGYVGTDGTITINGVSSIGATFNLSGKHQSWNVYGGAIGKVTAGTFNITIGTKDDATNKLTVGMVADVSEVTEVGSKSDCGGLIGHITSAGSYGNRIVNINNLIFYDVTVGNTTKTPTIANAAKTNAGGFLGYSWLKSTVNINGLTVTKGTINNCTTNGTAGGNDNVGVMCYEATGKWNVDKLTVTNMTMSNGGGTSVGMLVNKAYSGDDGLYLNVLKSGYTLTAATLPSLKKFDEIAAYSAKDAPTVVQGGKGVGVISINMNAGRHDPEASPADTYTDATITTLGTYQNQLSVTSSTQSSNYDNNTARYYYNLDIMDKDTDTAQDIVLWSVNQYAADNIKDEFVSTSTPFACESRTNVALSAYSYYPVYNVSSQTLSNINIEFGYNGIYTLEGNSTLNTDSYNRDPGEQNQHYLMQSGLFINSAENSTITLGTVELSGDFLENDTYQGVLISGTASGSISIDGLVLDGITPKYNNSGTISNYNTGYLLVKNVNRADSTKGNIQINLKNISTSNKYTVSSSTATVAKSLFGDVYGPAIGINIEDVKIDARSANGGLSALDTAYGTQNSIFTTATFFNSIMTSQAATMIYNYTLADDWSNGRNVTYGKEVKDSVEYAGQENKYYNSTTNYTDPTTNSNTTSGYDFGSWRPYVGQRYTANQTADANGCFYREIKVNVAAVAYSEGCGTYNDPYIIDSGAKLTAIAALINDDSKTSDLPSVILPKTLYDGVAANTTGARWCDSKNDHAVYTYTAGYYKSSGLPDWTVENVRLYLANAYYSISASTDNASGDIVLGNAFLGLGGTADNSGKFAFRGVIVGNGRTIVNNSSSPLVNVSNGCVIKGLTVNQNADISLNGPADPSPTKAYFGYNSQCSYYGGLIGEIMGGDNIIDNSYVKYSYTDSESVTHNTTVTLSGTNGTIVPVGGYVGVVVFGGLIFKNMTASKTTVANTGLNVVYSNGNTATTEGINLASETKTETDPGTEETTIVKNQEAWAAIYVNPLVGRVINGYAVNETGGNAKKADGETSVQQFSVTEDGKYHNEGRTARSAATVKHTLKNGTKHYSIADIDPYYGKTAEQWNALTDAQKNALMLDVSTVPVDTANDGTINVPNAQALFVLSLITQSTAGTAAEINGTAIDQSDTGEVETSREEDPDGNITIYKSRTIVNSLPAKDYTNSLSYGTYSNSVYGMSHNADYSDVGTNSAFTAITDYSELASMDTAASSAIPYIIRHYTVGSSETTTTTTTSTKTVEASAEGRIEVFEGSVDDLDGKEIRIKSGNYYLNAKANNGDHGVKADSETNATLLLVTKVKTGDNAGKFTLSFSDNGITKYVGFEGDSRKMRYSTNSTYWSIPYYFNIEKNGSIWRIYGNQTSTNQKYVAIRNPSQSTREFCGQNENDGADLTLYYYIPPTSVTTTTITTTNTTTTSISYPARCLTSTLGYYDIKLTGSGTYQLPDSFRGLGSVGYYDNTSDNTMQNADYANRQNNRYCMKVDTFNGNNITIDEDIYLNRYVTDNYFSKLHNSSNATQAVQNNLADYSVNTNTAFNGIGLFDSIVMKEANSKLDNFNLSGSINTAIFSNTYSASSQEQTGANNSYMWHSVGGVVGSSINGTRVNFSRIALNNFSVRGSSYIGGLLGHSGNKSTQIYIIIDRCSATGLKLDLAATDNKEKYRDALGGFVGKVKEGGVKIYGTADGDHSTTGAYSTVELSSVLCVNSDRAGAGGLVGYAGNGCEAYDMHVDAAEGCEVTIGGSNVSMVGGIVGSMQPAESKYSSCEAIFSNCEINGINLAAAEYAGGIYGGAHNNDWSPYSIKVTNCRVTGNSTTNNTITATNYAGGLIGDAYIVSVAAEGHANVEIADTIVSNYTISTSGNNTAAGGFIGYADAYTEATGTYANNSVVCYIHNSSVENCSIAVNGQYGGGVVGKIIKHSANKVLGYNIKLNNVTSTSSVMGAWIGWVDTNDSTTSIQFTGLAIYGNGFTKNVGNGVNLSNASFVFADYDETCGGTVPEGETERVYPKDISGFNYNENTHVEMPLYPYVNINPQISMGNDEIISGDGARLLSSKATGFTGTGSKTMAAKIYSELNTSGTAKQYYKTYYDTADADINGGDKINAYMNKSTTDDGDRISNYYDEKGYSTAQSYDNFACIVIANNTAPETTDLINRYAQLVTNTTTDYTEYSPYYNVVVNSCEYSSEDSKFVVSNSTAGLTWTEPVYTSTNGVYTTTTRGSFALNSSGADSMKSGDTFTLVDIQFKDPLHTDKIAYHLYIPVYTIKEIEVTFKAAVMNGTNSVSYNSTGAEDTNPYNTKKLGTATLDTHVDNLNTWYTTYIRYTYSHNDIEALLNTGNLNWNHNKYFYLDKTGFAATSMLPENTYMILVDPNGDHDNKYQVLLNTTDFARQSGTTSRITFDLTKFSDGTNNFSVCTFNELIAQKLKASKNAENNGRYNRCSETPEKPNTGDTRYVYTKDATGEITYYEYVGSGGAYDITLADGDVYENYYISMFVPGAKGDISLYGYYIRTPESFEAPSYASGTNNAITKSANVSCYFGDNTTTENRQVYIGNLFKQTTELTVLPNDLEIDNGNHTLNIYAKTTITPIDSNVATILNSVNADIYHSFNIYLDRKDGAITNTISGLENNEKDIKAWYSVETEIPQGDEADMTGISSIDRSKIDLQNSYINIATVDGGRTVLNTSGVTIYSRIRLDFDDYASEFPQKNASDTGVSVRASSNLAYDTASLAFSNMTASLEEPTATKHIYYRQSLDNAKLNYYAETELDSYDTDGAPSENYSRLGVSGKYSMNEYMPIDSTARYNVQNIENAWGDADNLVLTLSLQKKTDLPVGETYTSASYQDVSSIDAYWGAVQRDANNEVAPNAAGKPVTNLGATNLRITCGSYDQIVPVPANQNTFTLTIPKDAVGTSGFTIDENGYIYIGVGFNAKTGDGFTEYANYKVNLSVKLLDGDSDVTGSYADDYLIYTNAKVNHDFLKDH